MFTFRYEDGTVKEFTKEQLDDIAVQRIIKSCKQRFKKNHFIHLKDVIENELRLPKQLQLYKQVAYHFTKSGKYDCKDINDDFEIYKLPKKPWWERYAGWIALVSYVAGIFTPILTDIAKSYILPETKQESTKQVSKETKGVLDFPIIDSANDLSKH